MFRFGGFGVYLNPGNPIFSVWSRSLGFRVLGFRVRTLANTQVTPNIENAPNLSYILQLVLHGAAVTTEVGPSGNTGFGVEVVRNRTICLQGFFKGLLRELTQVLCIEIQLWYIIPS